MKESLQFDVLHLRGMLHCLGIIADAKKDFVTFVNCICYNCYYYISNI